MELQVKVGRFAREPAEALILPVEGTPSLKSGPLAALDRSLEGLIKQLLASGDFQGRLGETAVLYPQERIGARRLILTGLGPQEDSLDLESARRAGASAARRARELGAPTSGGLTIGLHRGLGPNLAGAAQALVEGVLLALYDYQANQDALSHLILLTEDRPALAEVQRGAEAGRVIGEAVNAARQLINQPANLLTPSKLAQAAQKMASRYGLHCDVLDPTAMKALHMGAMLAVSQGSQEPARFIVLEHKPPKGTADTLVLVGKGITFDSGGISLKEHWGMGVMKDDMSGGAAVLAALQAAAQLALPLHVVGLVPATENLPSGAAYKPGDVITSLSGKTIEVVSTDAEGRMVLADALTYAQRFKPKALIDIATLTSAIRVALGRFAIGAMGNDRALMERLRAAGERSGERIWELPLWDEYQEYIHSDVADMRNSAAPLEGILKSADMAAAGSIAGGMFLKQFAGNSPWAHLDIAGVSWTNREGPYSSHGATGIGVRLLTQFLRDWAAAPRRAKPSG